MTNSDVIDIGERQTRGFQLFSKRTQRESRAVDNSAAARKWTGWTFGYYTLTKERSEVTASAVAFRPVGESSGGPFAFYYPIPLSSPHSPSINPFSLHHIFYSYPRSRQRVGDSSWRVSMSGDDHLFSGGSNARSCLENSMKINCS
ncbi:hypothetical protein EVAR_7874_1 [Eumeta japonica]|uniref:Uncharacterized protein n=1 Tax=Eumeta variegata TaxID=151549 RepID=A0A4C1TV19_EUMVA|nr:hypothetical protein EVAR_7874_1 [Eumeta japonica]